MKSLHSFILVSVFAIVGCANEDVSTSQGEGEIQSTEIVDEAKGDEAKSDEASTCAKQPRNLLETCTSDCDCVEGLRCSPCTNTEATNCAEYCKAGDPFCNGGVVTCPLGAGMECAMVRLCQ